MTTQPDFDNLSNSEVNDLFEKVRAHRRALHPTRGRNDNVEIEPASAAEARFLREVSDLSQPDWASFPHMASKLQSQPVEEEPNGYDANGFPTVSTGTMGISAKKLKSYLERVS